MTLFVYEIRVRNDDADGASYQLVVKAGDNELARSEVVTPTSFGAIHAIAPSLGISLEDPVTLTAEKVERPAL